MAPKNVESDAARHEPCDAHVRVPIDLSDGPMLGIYGLSKSSRSFMQVKLFAFIVL